MFAEKLRRHVCKKEKGSQDLCTAGLCGMDLSRGRWGGLWLSAVPRQGQPGARLGGGPPSALRVFPHGRGRHGPKTHPALTDAHTPPRPQRPPQAMGDGQDFLLGHSTPAVSSAGFALLLKVCCCHSRLCRPWNRAYLKASTMSRPRLLKLARNWGSAALPGWA